jgi:hypothetical protein
MKRRAILLGHVDGLLSTNLDLDKVHGYLTSLCGGAWNSGEIIRQVNISRSALDELLQDTRTGKFDYVFFYFSGHGEYKRGSILELNTQEETISERLLSNLALRQLNIYDCCRTLPRTQSIRVTNSFSLVRLSESYDKTREYFRMMYDDRILQAYEQQMSLYSCSIGESSYDFGEGGVYTKYFIDSAKTSDETYVLASAAHSKACRLTTSEVFQHGKWQHPDYFMAKLPSRYQLICGLSSKLWNKYE